MNVWVLVLIYGISSWGAGGYREVPYPNKESCYEALNAIRITGQNQEAGDDDEQVIAFCKPLTMEGEHD